MTDKLPEPPRVDPAIVQAWRDRQLKNLPKDKPSKAEQITAANRLAALFNNPQTLTGGLTKTGAGGASVQVALDKPYKGLSTISAVAATGCDRFGRVTMLRDKNNDWYAFGGGTEKLRSDRDKERSGDDKSGEANPIKYLFSVIVTTDGVRDRVFYVGGHQATPEEVFKLPVAMQFVSANLNNVGSDGAVINVKLGDRLQCWDMAVKRWDLKVVVGILDLLGSRGYGFWSGVGEFTSAPGSTSNSGSELYNHYWVTQSGSDPSTVQLFDSGAQTGATNVNVSNSAGGVTSSSYSLTSNIDSRFLPKKTIATQKSASSGSAVNVISGGGGGGGEGTQASDATGTEEVLPSILSSISMINQSGTAAAAAFLSFKKDRVESRRVVTGGSTITYTRTVTRKGRHAWVSMSGVSFYKPNNLIDEYSITDTESSYDDRTAQEAFNSKTQPMLFSLTSITVAPDDTLEDWTSESSVIDCFDDSFTVSRLKRFWQKNADGSIKLPKKEIAKNNDWAKTEDLETFPMEVETFTKEFKSDGKEDREVYVIPEDVLPQDENPLATPQALSAIAPIPDIYRKVTSLNKYFLYEPSSTTTADNITVIRPSGIPANQPGRWLESTRYVVYAYSYFPPN